MSEELIRLTDSDRYGREIVERLSAELTKLFGKGFSKVSLWRCARFYRAFLNIVSSAMTQSQLLTWTHYQALQKEHVWSNDHGAVYDA